MSILLTDNGVQEVTNKTISSVDNDVRNIGTSELEAKYNARNIISSLDVDWSLAQVFTKILTANTVLTFSDIHIGSKDLVISGDYTLALPSWVKIIVGEYIGTEQNHIQINCTNDSVGNEEGWASFSGGGDVVVPPPSGDFFDITSAVLPSSLLAPDSTNLVVTIHNTGDTSGTQNVLIEWYKDSIYQSQQIESITVGSDATVVTNINKSFTSGDVGDWYAVVTSLDDTETSNIMEVTAAPEPAFFQVITITNPANKEVGQTASAKIYLYNTGDFADTQDIIITWKKDGVIKYQHTVIKTIAAKTSSIFYDTFLWLPEHAGTGWTITVDTDDHSLTSSSFEVTAGIPTAQFEVVEIVEPVNLEVGQTAIAYIEITNEGGASDTQDVTVIWKKNGVVKLTEVESVTLDVNENTVFSSSLLLLTEHIGTGWQITVTTEYHTVLSATFEIIALQSFFDVTLVTIPTPLTVGSLVTSSTTVENTGVSSDTQTIRRVWRQGGVIKKDVSFSQTLPGETSATTSIDHVWTTADIGFWILTSYSEDDDESTIEFEVTA